MYSVVGVRFKKAGKIYYFDPLDLPVEKEQSVIVETARGIEYGQVVIGKKEVGESDVVLPLKKVIRIAGDSDARVVEENKQAAKDAFTTCLNKIRDHELKMKLVDVEFTFDRNKIIFYFTAEGRVDFRELVKDLASIFRTRIELRQIGVRDEAKCSAVLDLADAYCAVPHGLVILSRYRSRWQRIKAYRSIRLKFPGYVED